MLPDIDLLRFSHIIFVVGAIVLASDCERTSQMDDPEVRWLSPATVPKEGEGIDRSTTMHIDSLSHRTAPFDVDGPPLGDDDLSMRDTGDGSRSPSAIRTQGSPGRFTSSTQYIDPLDAALRPPANETPEQRERRMKAEDDAKKRSNDIDRMLRENDRHNRKGKVVKVLLLGQSESGKSTTLKRTLTSSISSVALGWVYLVDLKNRGWGQVTYCPFSGSRDGADSYGSYLSVACPTIHTFPAFFSTLSTEPSRQAC